MTAETDAAKIDDVKAKPSKTRKVRLPITIVDGEGKSYPPGTLVTLATDEANNLIERFGEVTAPGGE